MGIGSNPSSEAKISHDSWPKNQSIKQKQCCIKFSKDFKNGPHQKILNLKKCMGYHIFPGGSEVKASASNAGDTGLIPGLGRSPGEGNGNPLQYSWLENPMDGEAW